jgi:hypothetical protein
MSNVNAARRDHRLSGVRSSGPFGAKAVVAVPLERYIRASWAVVTRSPQLDSRRRRTSTSLVQHDIPRIFDACPD